MNKEWLISSALLLAALILLRALAGKRLRPGLRYGLWALALLRLLIPVSFISVSMRPGEVVRELAAPLLTSVESAETLEKPVYAGTMADTPLTIDEAEARHGGEVYKIQGYPADGEIVELHSYFFRDSLKNVLSRLLPKLWLAGVSVTAAAFALENLRFALRLRRRRRRIEADCPLPVYAVEGLESSCLFGWTVYVSAASAQDERTLRHVLAHEMSHFRHGDGLWALLRAIALALHWFDPLAWWAAALSRRDSELWADADAVKRLGADEWEAYGRTLIALSAGKPGAGLLNAATTMSGGKKALRERVSMIARRGKAPLWVAVLVLLIGILAALCAFSGKKERIEPVTLTGTRYGNLSELYREDYAGTVTRTPAVLTIENVTQEGAKLALDCTLKADGEKKEKFSFTVELREGLLSDGRRVLIGYESFVSGPHSVSEFILTDGTAADEIRDRALPARFILHLRGLDGWCTFSALLPGVLWPCLEGDYPDDVSSDRLASAEKALARAAEPVYSLTIAASEGGSFPAGLAARIAGDYAPGDEIPLSVRPDPGWRFDHWELSAGTVDAPDSGDAVFTMPDCDAEVKPVFIPDDAAGQDDSADKAWLRWANDLYAPEAPQILSEAELQGWTDWFYEDDHRMGFLTSTYLNPAEIDLDELLYTGIGHNATQEEVRAYLAHTGNWVTECPTDVMPRTEVLSYLRQYTGADFGELTLGYNYVPESDCWYHAHGDTNIGGVMLTGGVRCGDEVLLFYREGEFCVTLDVSGEAPRFRKNVACEWDSAGRALETVSRRESASEARVLTGLAPVFTTEPISYGSHDRAIAALESLTSTVNGKEVPIEIIPDCGAGYHTDGAWKRWPVNGGDPVYGEFREGESAVGALYFVYEDGRVLPLPMPGTAEGSCRMKVNEETDEPGAFYLSGEGDLVIWSCVMPEAVLLPDETGAGYTSVIYTLFVPTGEVFIRTGR